MHMFAQEYAAGINEMHAQLFCVYDTRNLFPQDLRALRVSLSDIIHTHIHKHSLYLRSAKISKIEQRFFTKIKNVIR